MASRPLVVTTETFLHPGTHFRSVNLHCPQVGGSKHGTETSNCENFKLCKWEKCIYILQGK